MLVRASTLKNKFYKVTRGGVHPDILEPPPLATGPEYVHIFSPCKLKVVLQYDNFFSKRVLLV